MLKEAFHRLTNSHGLVLMRVLLPFAPYPAGSLAGFPPDEAERIYSLKAAVPVDVDGSALELTGVDVPVAPKPKAVRHVDVPLNWDQVHHLQRNKWAKEIAGVPDMKIDDDQAREIIRGYLESVKEDA